MWLTIQPIPVAETCGGAEVSIGIPPIFRFNGNGDLSKYAEWG